MSKTNNRNKKQKTPTQAKRVNKSETIADEYGELSVRRAKMIKLSAWVAIMALIITTGITFGVASLGV